MTAQLYSVKFLMATVSTLATSSLSCSLWHLVSAPLYASVQPTNTQGTLALTAATASKFDDVLQVTMTTLTKQQVRTPTAAQRGLTVQ